MIKAENIANKEFRKSLFGYDREDVDKYLESDETRHDLAEIMYATFIKRICEVILACGKTPVVWEGFRHAVIAL